MAGMRWCRARWLRAFTVGTAVALVCMLFVSCGGSREAARPSAKVIPINEGDFYIEAPKTLSAGNYTLRIHNVGPNDNELIVSPTRTGILPMRAEGITVDEEAIEHEEAGSVEPGPPGDVRYLPVHLNPGRYILFCNMEGTFLAGMHAEIVVSA
jgi:uncharacterized cupredoxin-like copper-binding protein